MNKNFERPDFCGMDPNIIYLSLDLPNLTENKSSSIVKKIWNNENY